MGTSRLGALLVDEGLLTEKDRRTIRRSCGHEGSAFAKSVVALGLLNEDELAAFLAERTPHRIVAKDITTEAQTEALGAVDRPLIERLEVVPLRLDDRMLTVARVDPLDHDTVRQLEFFTGYKIKPVIATFSQIRAGLLKMMKEFKPKTSHLEDFLGNHAIAATRRLAMLAGGVAAPKRRAAATAKDAPAAPAATAAPVAMPEPVAAAEDDGLVYPGQVDEELDAPVAGAADEAAFENADPQTPLDTAVATTGGDDDVAEESIAGGEGGADLGALEGIDELEGLENLDGIDGIDGIDGLENADTKPAAAEAVAESADAAGSIELEGDAALDDLMASDAEADLFAGDDDADPAAPAPAAASAAGAAPAAETDDALEELGGGDDALDEEGAIALGDDMDTGLEAGAAEGLGDLGEDLGELGGELGAEGAPELPGADKAGSAGDDEDLVFGSEDTAASGLDDELTAELGEDLTGVGEDDLGGDLTNDAGDALSDAAVGGGTFAPPEPDPLAEVAASDTPRIVATVNRSLMKISMAKDGPAAATQAFAAFSAAGMATGVFYHLQDKNLVPCSGWRGGKDSLGADDLAALKSAGLAAALERLEGDWTPLDSGSRELDLKPFATWATKEQALMAASVPTQTAGRKVALVGAWDADKAQDSAVRDSAMEVLKQVGKKFI
jgi:hypothetical protein